MLAKGRWRGSSSWKSVGVELEDCRGVRGLRVNHLLAAKGREGQDLRPLYGLKATGGSLRGSLFFSFLVDR